MIDMNDLKDRLATILQSQKLGFLGLKFVGILHKYQKKDGIYYYQDYKNNEFEGVTDDEGNYLYAYYRGNIKELQSSYMIPLSYVISMPNCNIDITDVVAMIAHLMRNNTQSLRFEDISIQTNKQTVFLREFGAKLEKQKSETQLAYIDFNVFYPRPNWDCLDLNCEC